MIRGIDFYKYTLPLLKHHPNFDIVVEDIKSLTENQEMGIVQTSSTTYQAPFVFNSALRPRIESATCNYILQHFKGWVIQTPNDVFDEDVATFMDFDIEQEGEARFFYVLPSSKREALVEIAIFSNDLLKDSEYEKLVETYIHDKLGIPIFEISHKEFGVIPMTDYDFESHHTKRIIQIGTSGGQVKPSSGYAFSRIQKHIAQIVENLNNQKHPLPSPKK